MPAPSFATETETANWFTQGTSKATPGFDANAGDILVACGASEDEAPTLTISNSGAALTWTQAQVGALTDYGWASIWTAPVDTNRTGMTVTFTRSGTNLSYGGSVLVFRDSDGVGTSAKNNATTGTPSVGFLTTAANSAVVALNSDWNAADGTTRTWRTINSITPTSGNGLERVYQRNASIGAYYVAYWSDAGANGASITAGTTAPAGQKWQIIAVEIKGTASGAAPKLLASLGVG